ncbi:uncharacterized protein [Triticum aestivum]|uniref:uncharacterized protein n=1 Tax=Triticum aestivum TaxID=4565 RepID=UPI001D015000|nr:uncharacterized protein LOC123039567 [Triticum aestivum]
MKSSTFVYERNLNCTGILMNEDLEHGYIVTVVLLTEFQTFEDKSSAINQNTGVSERLAEMIRVWLPGKKMAVGKPEYKKITEERLEIECLYNERVMEVMWGIQNCMPGLIPIEKSQLAKEDRLPSKGLQEFLKCYGCNVKPEMVNEQIVATASTLSACDYVEKKYSLVLREAGAVIKDVSGISCEGWSLLDIATALKIIWKPKKVGNSSLVSKDEALRLVNDASKYEALVNKYPCFRAYKDMSKAHDDRISKELLKSLVEGLKKP